MKTRIKHFLYLSFFILASVGCEGNETNSININQIDTNSSYLKLSLTDIKWKLIGFVNEKNKTIKMAQPESNSCYILNFFTDGTFIGITSTNNIQGEYETNSQTKKLDILRFSGTEINELFDGKKFTESLQVIEAFAITERGLELYYNMKKDYLLFKPI